MVITLPKIRQHDGKGIMTTVRADFIKGMEPSKVQYKGQSYPGTKVYLKDGRFFKVLAHGAELAKGWAHAIQSGDPVCISAGAGFTLSAPVKAKMLAEVSSATSD